MARSLILHTYSYIVSLVHNQWRSWKHAIDINHFSRNAIGGTKIPGQIEIVVDLGSLCNPCYTEPETCEGHGCNNSVEVSRWIVWVCRYVDKQNPILWGSARPLMFIHLLRWLLLMHPGIELGHHLKTNWVYVLVSWTWKLMSGMQLHAFLFRNIPGVRLTNTIAIVDCFPKLSN